MPDTGPDLSNAQAAVERLMDDEATVTRGAPGWDDATEDPDTLQLTVPARQTVYAGRCMLSSRTSGYQLTIPLGDGTADVRQGDVVTPTRSRRDPLMTGRQFTVAAEATVRTFAVSRRFALEEIARPLPGLG